MAAFRQLLFDVAVDLDISLYLLHLTAHLVVFEEQFLGLLGLAFELRRQLVILEDCQARCGL